jgi:diguanylate cyclase (GGDEF)-like protein/PAS domain S-box-containing protein
MEPTYKKLIDFASDGIFRYTFPGDIVLFANKGALNIIDLDCQPSEIEGKRLDELIMFTESKAAMRGILESRGEVRGFEYHFKTLKGSDRWVILDAFVTVDEATGRKTVEATMKDITGHKNIEDTLERERNILSTTINALPVYIYFKDVESRFVMANSATARAMGASSPRDLIGKTDRDFYPPDMAEHFIADEREIIATGRPLANREELVKTASGDMRWLLTTKVPLFDKTGKATGIVGIGRDITERKRAEEALRQQEERYRGMYESSPLAFVVWDRDCRITDWNKQAEKIFGWTREEVMGKNFFDFLIPESNRSAVGGAVSDILNGKPPEPSINENLTKRGETILCEWNNSAQRDRNGNVTGVMSLALDITERKRAEDALAVSEESYRAVFNTANDAIFILDIETARIVDVNEKACEMYIYPKEEMLRLSVQDLSLGRPPYMQGDIMAFINKASRGEPQLFEWVAKDRAQRFFWVEINLKRAVIGGKYRILAIVRDISERKRSEERWSKIHEAFLNFSADPNENINRLTALCGELMGSDCALYNRLEEGSLRSCGQWNCPSDFVPVDKAEGHICFDVIKNKSDEVVVIRNLQETAYAHSDPNVSKYNLQTYIGRAVKFGDSCVGSLCVVYQHDFNPSEEDAEIMGFIALAIGVEEERKSAEEMSQIAQFAIEHSADPIFWIGPDARILYINEMTCKALGYSREELLGMTVSDIDPNFPSDIWPDHWKEIKERGSFSFETKHRRKDGTLFPVEVTVNYLSFQGGEYNFASARDITQRKKQEEDLLRRDYQLEILSRTSQHINAVLDIPVILRTLVAAAIELVDATAGTAGLMEAGRMVFGEYNRNGKAEPVDYVSEPGRGMCGCVTNAPKTYICNNVEADPHISREIQNSFGIYNLVNVPILNREGALLGCLEIHNKNEHNPFDAQDVFMLQGLAASASIAIENATVLLQRDKAEKALKWQKDYYETLLDEANVWIEVLDTEGRVLLWNKKAEEITGYRREGLKGNLNKWSLQYPDPAHRNRMIGFVRKLIASGKTIKDLETEVAVSTGKRKIISLSSNIIRDDNGNIAGGMFVGVDVTDRKRSEKEREFLNREIVKSNKRLQQLALKDSHTGLYNHHYLSEVIEPELYRARRYGHSLSLTMIDIDYFKSVNDLYGHEFGDLVLRQFSRHLRQMVRKYDIVVRFGGEEFIIISSGSDRTKALALGQRILESVNIYNFGDKKHVMKLKLSVAIASYPEDAISKGMDLVDLADKILAKAKEAGGNVVCTANDLRRSKKLSLKREDIRSLKDKIVKLTRRGKQSLIESIFAFAKTLEMRDHYTGKHAESTVYYSTEIAKALKLNREDMDHVRQAAVLHDLGKVGISDKILHKKSRLSPKEYEEIKKHPQIAADIIRPIQFMHDIIPLILYHHERWDGKGYPAGLKHKEIPIGARIISIADVYQALTSDRPYRKAYPKKEAMKIIKEGAGTQFDPAIVEAFLEILKKENGLSPAKAG